MAVTDALAHVGEVALQRSADAFAALSYHAVPPQGDAENLEDERPNEAEENAEDHGRFLTRMVTRSLSLPPTE